MASNADTFLKVAVGVSFLFGALAVGNHYLIYLPKRDAELDAERSRNRTEQQLREDQAKRLAEYKEEAQRQAAAAKAESVQTRYNLCLQDAITNYNAGWDFSCNAISERNLKNRASCTFGKELCDRTYPATPVKNCSLPLEVSKAKSESLEKNRNRCLQESRSGFQ